MCMSKSESELKWISELGKNPPIIAASCDLNGIWRGKRVPLANLEKVLELIAKFKPKKAILTNLHSDLDYEILRKKLPKNILPAYDGLTLTL